MTAYSETKPYGASHDPATPCVTSGDTLAMVRLTRKGGTVPAQAFRADGRPPGPDARLTGPPKAEPHVTALPAAHGQGRRLDLAAALTAASLARSTPCIEIFFEALLVLVCVGVLAFAGLP